jgi:hypothetical protein
MIQEMPLEVVDLRSDTVTRPTSAMREAMMVAPLGDDVFGDDPTVNALQERIAGLLGFEAALFVPTGTQSNLCAHAGALPAGRRIPGRPDGALLPLGGRWRCGVWQHPAPADCAPGPMARWRWPTSRPPSSRTMRTLPAPGCWHWKTPWVASCCRLNMCKVGHGLARRHGLSTHLDGARLFNAAVAQAALTGGAVVDEARRIAQCFDSVSVCFSKGWARRSARHCAVRQSSSACPPCAQDGRGWHAPGGHAGGGGPACAGPSCRAPGRRPRTGPATGGGSGGRAGFAGGSAAHQHRVCRPGGRCP